MSLQQDDDLPNMAAVTKKDPGDLEFKLNHRDICRKYLTSVDYSCIYDTSDHCVHVSYEILL